MAQVGVSRRAWAVVGCAWFMSFAMFSRILCLPPMGNMVREALSLTHSKIGLIFSLPVAILAVTAIPCGLLGDRIGPRKAAGIGAVIMTLGSFATGTATDFWSLFAYTCIFGIGFSMAFTSLPKLMGLWFPLEKVGMATGIYVTGVAIGAAVALGITLPVVFPLAGGFRGIFYFWSLPSAIGAVLWWLVVKERTPSSVAAQDNLRSGEAQTGYSIWKNRNLWFLGFVIFFQNMHFYTWTGWTPQLMIMKGASPGTAGLMISLMSWVSIPCMFLVPWASHKVGLVKPFIWVSAIGFALAAWAAIGISVRMGWPLMAFLGVLVCTFPLLLALPVDLVPEKFVGRASGMVLSIGYFGALIGPWLAGHILDVAGNLNPALAVLVGAAIAYGGFSLFLPETGAHVKT